MQPRVGVFGRSFSDTCSIRPPKQNWVLADISELKGQALLGERHRAWVAFISGRNRKCLPRFSKRVSSKRHCGAHNGSTLSNLWKMLPLHWKRRVLTTGPPGKSCFLFLSSLIFSGALSDQASISTSPPKFPYRVTSDVRVAKSSDYFSVFTCWICFVHTTQLITLSFLDYVLHFVSGPSFSWFSFFSDGVK